MSKRLIGIVLILLVLGSVAGLSAKASVFDIGIINAMPVERIIATDFTVYFPGLRLQANVAPWFGIAVAGLYDQVESDSSHRVYVSTDAVMRIPMGFIEPYIALGPLFVLRFPNSFDPTPLEEYGYHVRAGFDINFNSWFALGFDGELPILDVEEFMANLASIDGQYFLDNVLASIVVKVKF